MYGNGKPGLTTIVASLVSQAAIVKWFGLTFGVLMCGLLWGIFTHTVEIVAK
ncbi:hypothetical protein CCP3SC15_1920013 [Gammaproteobacteria bacterium]